MKGEFANIAHRPGLRVMTDPFCPLETVVEEYFSTWRRFLRKLGFRVKPNWVKKAAVAYQIDTTIIVHPANRERLLRYIEELE